MWPRICSCCFPWFGLSWLASVSGGPLGWFWISQWTWNFQPVRSPSSLLHAQVTNPSRTWIQGPRSTVLPPSLPSLSLHRPSTPRTSSSLEDKKAVRYTICIWESGRGQGGGENSPLLYTCILITGRFSWTYSCSLVTGITRGSALSGARGPVDGMAEALWKGWQRIIWAFNLAL